MDINLKQALNDPVWQAHKIGDIYSMDNKSGWRIAYYPLFGTYDNKLDKYGDSIDKQWIDFEEPRALVEKPIKDGIDFREVPLRYLTKSSAQ